MLFSLHDTKLQSTLVNQKDTLILGITYAHNAYILGEEAKKLSLVEDLWHLLGYGYKVAELQGRIRQRACDLIQTETLVAATCRLSPNRRAEFEEEVAALEKLSHL